MAKASINVSCISLYSYIKPQLIELLFNLSYVVYLYIPTSNHNDKLYRLSIAALYIFIFLHQTTTCFFCKR